MRQSVDYSVAQSPRVLLDGLADVESPRWLEDRLWFHWEPARSSRSTSMGAVKSSRRARPVSGGRRWLPDGRLLVTGPELVVDGRGNIYVNRFGFDFRRR